MKNTLLNFAGFILILVGAFDKCGKKKSLPPEKIPVVPIWYFNIKLISDDESFTAENKTYTIGTEQEKELKNNIITERQDTTHLEKIGMKNGEIKLHIHIGNEKDTSFVEVDTTMTLLASTIFKVRDKHEGIYKNPEIEVKILRKKKIDILIATFKRESEKEYNELMKKIEDARVATSSAVNSWEAVMNLINSLSGNLVKSNYKPIATKQKENAEKRISELDSLNKEVDKSYNNFLSTVHNTPKESFNKYLNDNNALALEAAGIKKKANKSAEDANTATGAIIAHDKYDFKSIQDNLLFDSGDFVLNQNAENVLKHIIIPAISAIIKKANIVDSKEKMILILRVYGYTDGQNIGNKIYPTIRNSKFSDDNTTDKRIEHYENIKDICDKCNGLPQKNDKRNNTLENTCLSQLRANNVFYKIKDILSKNINPSNILKIAVGKGQLNFDGKKVDANRKCTIEICVIPTTVIP